MAVVAAIVAVGLLLLGVGFAVQDSVRTVSAAVLSRPQVVPGITPCGLERGDGANDPFELG